MKLLRLLLLLKLLLLLLLLVLLQLVLLVLDLSEMLLLLLRMRSVWMGVDWVWRLRRMRRRVLNVLLLHCGYARSLDGGLSRVRGEW
jgi:hypothetical protein